MKNETKVYAKVTELSEQFEAWEQKKEHPNASQPIAIDYLFWQARFQLVIAQQLTMISQHLGKIVANAEARIRPE